MPEGVTPTASPAAPGAVGLPPMPPLETAAAQEMQTLNQFLHEPTAGLIRKLYDYLTANSAQYTELINCVPGVAQAAQRYGAGDYVGAFNTAYQAYRSLALLRQRIPALPPLPGM